jgi:hypothetical protein
LPPTAGAVRSSRFIQSDPRGDASGSGSTGVGMVASRARGICASAGKYSKRGNPDLAGSVIILLAQIDLIADDVFDV